MSTCQEYWIKVWDGKGKGKTMRNVLKWELLSWMNMLEITPVSHFHSFVKSLKNVLLLKGSHLLRNKKDIHKDLWVVIISETAPYSMLNHVVILQLSFNQTRDMKFLDLTHRTSFQRANTSPITLAFFWRERETASCLHVADSNPDPQEASIFLLHFSEHPVQSRQESEHELLSSSMGTLGGRIFPLLLAQDHVGGTDILCATGSLCLTRKLSALIIRNIFYFSQTS